MIKYEFILYWSEDDNTYITKILKVRKLYDKQLHGKRVSAQCGTGCQGVTGDSEGIGPAAVYAKGTIKACMRAAYLRRM